MYLKTALLLVWFGASYALLVFAATNLWLGALLSLSLGSRWPASVSASSTTPTTVPTPAAPRVNRVMGMTLDMLGASSYLWRFKHNLAHHTYTNLAGADDDINFVPFARLSPAQPRLRLHRLQQFYLWALYWFLFPKWNFVDDFKTLSAGANLRARVSRGRAARRSPAVRGQGGVHRLGVRGPAAVPPVVGRAAVLRHDLARPRHHAGGGVHARPLRGRGGVSRAAAGDGATAAPVGGAPGPDHGRLRARQSAADLVRGRAQLPDRASPVSRASATSITRASRRSCRRRAPSSASATPRTPPSAARSPHTGAGSAAWDAATRPRGANRSARSRMARPCPCS